MIATTEKVSLAPEAKVLLALEAAYHNSTGAVFRTGAVNLQMHTASIK